MLNDDLSYKCNSIIEDKDLEIDSFDSLFFFVFVILFYVGTHLARGYSSGDPRNHYRYTHTYSYTQRN